MTIKVLGVVLFFFYNLSAMNQELVLHDIINTERSGTEKSDRDCDVKIKKLISNKKECCGSRGCGEIVNFFWKCVRPSCIIDLNAPDGDRNTALHLACKKGFAEVVGTLILEGADVRRINNDRRTALHVAVAAGDNGSKKIGAVVRMMSSLDGLNEIVTLRDSQDNTPLHIVLSAKIDDDVCQSIMGYIVHACPEVINYKGHQGLTSLHLAVRRKKLEVLKYLLIAHHSLSNRQSLSKESVEVLLKRWDPKTGGVMRAFGFNLSIELNTYDDHLVVTPLALARQLLAAEVDDSNREQLRAIISLLVALGAH